MWSSGSSSGYGFDDRKFGKMYLTKINIF